METMDEGNEEMLYQIDLDLLDELGSFIKPFIREKLTPLCCKLKNIQGQINGMKTMAEESRIRLDAFSSLQPSNNQQRTNEEDEDVRVVSYQLPSPVPSQPPPLKQIEQKKVVDQDPNGDEVIHVGQYDCRRPDLPQPGLLAKKQLEARSRVFFHHHKKLTWIEGTISRVHRHHTPFKYELAEDPGSWYSPAHLAYTTSPKTILQPGVRILVNETNHRGIVSLRPAMVAEPPKVNNKHRYMVFFDNGDAQYTEHYNIYLICDTNLSSWNNIDPEYRNFYQEYARKYPERAMLKLMKGQVIKTKYNDQWFISRVDEVDCNLVKMFFYLDEHSEWIYRGSMRLGPLCNELLSAENTRISRKGRRHNLLPKKPCQPYVEYTRGLDESTESDVLGGTEQDSCTYPSPSFAPTSSKLSSIKKSTSSSIANSTALKVRPEKPISTPAHEPIRPPYVQDKGCRGERVKIPFKPTVHRVTFENHDCGPSCLQEPHGPAVHVGQSFLSIPILFGWERHLLKKKKLIQYRTPCGRVLNNMDLVYMYLKLTESKLTVDYFTFDSEVDVSQEFRAQDVKVNLPDITYGMEMAAVQAVNAINKEFPPYVEYSTQRSATKNVPLNIDPEFLSCCDCIDDCRDSNKCQCQQLTKSNAESIGIRNHVGYTYRKLLEPLVTGIFECNSSCKCKSTCLNRVVQNGLRNRLQVFKTEKRGWGIRSLDDIPQGMFICIYAGQLLTDQGADEDGNTYGDEYYAELDYIEVLEKIKEDYESEAHGPGIDEDDYDSLGRHSSSSSLSSLSSDEDKDDGQSDDDVKDANFMLPHVKISAPTGRYSTRSKTKPVKKEEEIVPKPAKSAKKKSKKKAPPPPPLPKKPEESRQPLRSFYGEDSCFIMDAKSSGNIGRYLNHSCDPNVIVQNVFVDTHDLRFPWVAFFANRFIPSGSELTWDYNYEIGSVPGKIIHCHCGSDKCRGRLI